MSTFTPEVAGAWFLLMPTARSCEIYISSQSRLAAVTFRHSLTCLSTAPLKRPARITCCYLPSLPNCLRSSPRSPLQISTVAIQPPTPLLVKWLSLHRPWSHPRTVHPTAQARRRSRTLTALSTPLWPAVSRLRPTATHTPHHP